MKSTSKLLQEGREAKGRRADRLEQVMNDLAEDMNKRTESELIRCIGYMQGLLEEKGAKFAKLRGDMLSILIQNK